MRDLRKNDVKFDDKKRSAAWRVLEEVGLAAEVGVLDKAKGDSPDAKVQVGNQGDHGIIGDVEEKPGQQDDREDKSRAHRIVPQDDILG